MMQILDAVELGMPLLTLGVICLLFVGVGIMLIWSYIYFFMLCRVWWSIMTVMMETPQILSYGLLVLIPRGVGWFMRFEILLGS